MIRPAKLGEMTDIITITKACASHMVKNNIFQWNASYPSISAFENDINRKELYVLEIKGNLIGTRNTFLSIG